MLWKKGFLKEALTTVFKGKVETVNCNTRYAQSFYVFWDTTSFPIFTKYRKIILVDSN